MGTLRSFVKYKRKELGITQEELTTNAGLGLNFVRDLEQSKKTLRLDNGFEYLVQILILDMGRL